MQNRKKKAKKKSNKEITFFNPESFFYDLPIELLVYIISFITKKEDLAQLFMVSKSFGLIIGKYAQIEIEYKRKDGSIEKSKMKYQNYISLFKQLNVIDKKIKDSSSKLVSLEKENNDQIQTNKEAYRCLNRIALPIMSLSLVGVLLESPIMTISFFLTGFAILVNGGVLAFYAALGLEDYQLIRDDLEQIIRQNENEKSDLIISHTSPSI